jgi:hypothetical protein
LRDRRATAFAGGFAGVGNDQRGDERTRRLRGKRTHHHDRLDSLAQTHLIPKQPAASGCGQHAVDAVELVRIGKRADT